VIGVLPGKPKHNNLSAPNSFLLTTKELKVEPTEEEIMELGAFSVKNILTFNPGWNSEAQPLSEFTGVRELQRRLKARGVSLIPEADERSTGPASFMMADPDGNTILVDQHV
jgi:hypothetical protein